MKTEKPETSGALRTDDNEPDVASMQAELQDAMSNGVDYLAAMRHGADVRYCRWPGQRQDGRKPDTVRGRRAEPWPRASDVRIRLADELVNDSVTLMRTAGRRSLLTIKATEGGDVSRAGKVQIYLDHLRNTKIRRNVARAQQLAAQWRQTYGYAFIAVTWQREHEIAYETLTLADLTEQAAAGPETPAAILLAQLYEPDTDVKGQLARMLTRIYEPMDRSEAYRQLKALRETGSMTVPVRRLRVNLPQWKALMPWRDVFFPVNTEDEQEARWIGWRRTFNRAQVEDKALSEGWSEESIAAVLGTEGSTILETQAKEVVAGDRRTHWRDDAEEMEGLFEVFYLYHTAVDAAGTPTRWLTVLSPHVSAESAQPAVCYDGPLDYRHGKFPFVACRRELPEAAIVDSRGIPELVHTQQLEVKHARDARIDQTDLQLRPPLIRPEREIGLPLTIQPRGEIGERRANQTRFMSITPTAQQATPLEQAARDDVNSYFARNRDTDPVRTTAYEQALADDWCEELAEAWTMTLQLAQQFEEEVEFSRTVGGQAVPFRVTADEIQGQHDIQLFYNTENADPEKMQAKTDRLAKVYVPLDRYGILNLAPVVGGLFARDFPEYADVAVQGVEQAGQKEIEDEQKNWALMLAGEEPIMRDKGQNFQLRLQWLQAKNAQPAAQARLAALPDSMELVQKRLEHLTFMVQQDINADTGRVGVQAGPADAAAVPAAA